MPGKRIPWMLLMSILLIGVLPIIQYRLEGGGDAIDIASLPSRDLLPLEQLAQALAGLVIKPIYMMISLVIILALIGQKSADLFALQWGQIAFLAGETFCAINFYIYRHESILSEYLHSYGMALAFGLTSFAIWEGLDSRILHLSNSKFACNAATLCGVCPRRAQEGCKAAGLARFFILILAILTFIPLLSPLQPEAYAVSIFGFPYSYTRLNIYEIYERRVLPVMTLIFFVLAFIPLVRKSKLPIPASTKILVCAGLGALSFSFFRLALNAIFNHSLVWFEFWEEATELIFVGAIAFLLWQFQRTLFERTTILESLGINAKPSQTDPSRESPQA